MYTESLYLPANTRRTIQQAASARLRARQKDPAHDPTPLEAGPTRVPLPLLTYDKLRALWAQHDRQYLGQ